jgi:hypothetical protein
VQHITDPITDQEVPVTLLFVQQLLPGVHHPQDRRPREAAAGLQYLLLLLPAVQVLQVQVDQVQEDLLQHHQAEAVHVQVREAVEAGGNIK